MDDLSKRIKKAKEDAKTQWRIQFHTDEEYGGALKFARMGFIEHLYDFIEPASDMHPIRGQVEQTLNVFGDHIKKREKQIREGRLSRVNQYGHRGRPIYKEGNSGKSFTVPADSIPFFRSNHLLAASPGSMILKFNAGGKPKDAMEATEGCTRHDDGHPAFSHCGENSITQPPFNMVSHEDRGLAMTQDDKGLLGFVIEKNLDLSHITAAQAETGLFPTQSLADNVYVIHDTPFFADPLPKHFFWSVAESVEGAYNGMIVVNDPRPALQVLRYRREGHRKFYSSPLSRRVESAYGELFRYSMLSHIFSPPDVMLGVDADIDFHFQRMLVGAIEVPPWVRSLLGVARGDMEELEKWTKYTFEPDKKFTDQAEADADAKQRYEDKLKELEWRRDVIPVPVRDFASKRIHVVSPSGRESWLKAEDNRDLIDRTYEIYTFNK